MDAALPGGGLTIGGVHEISEAGPRGGYARQSAPPPPQTAAVRARRAPNSPFQAVCPGPGSEGPPRPTPMSSGAWGEVSVFCSSLSWFLAQGNEVCLVRALEHGDAKSQSNEASRTVLRG